MSTRTELVARFKAFLDKNYPCRGVAGCCGEEEEANYLADIAYELMRPLSLYELEVRNNPERMRATRRKMQEEAKAVRREQNQLRAEHFRKAQESAFTEGMLAQFEADLLGKPGPQNPYEKPSA